MISLDLVAARRHEAALRPRVFQGEFSDTASRGSDRKAGAGSSGDTLCVWVLVLDYVRDTSYVLLDTSRAVVRHAIRFTG